LLLVKLNFTLLFYCKRLKDGEENKVLTVGRF